MKIFFYQLLFHLFLYCYCYNNNQASIYIDSNWNSLSNNQNNQNNNEVMLPQLTSNNFQFSTTEIFISINNFIDSERCSKSLFNYISKAQYPQRLKFGIVQQVNTEEDTIKDDCIKKYCELIQQQYPCKNTEQMKSILFSKRLARGPAHSHAYDESLMENEDFCLLSDSHIDVIQNWDTELMNMWGMINNEYAVLSTTLPSLEVLGKKINNRWEVPHLCHYSWDDNGLAITGPPAIVIDLEGPLLASAWSDSFSFSKCHAQKKTLNDPNILRLDSPVTNVLKYARLWTRGYDVYTPHRSIIAHSIESSATDWKQYGMSPVVKTRELVTSIERVKTILGMPGGKKDLQDIIEIEKYGLGTKRTLDQFIQFIGVDFRNGELVDNRCKNLNWIPFQPDKDPECEFKDVWGLAPEPQTAYLPIIPSYTPNIQNQQKGINQRKSLPWPFNFMDRTIELAIKELSYHSNRDEAIQMLKVILLIIPIGVGLLALATWSIISAGDEFPPPRKDSFFGNDLKNI